jgi:N-acyl-D-aspartate/D-glutamate deacylase
MLDHRIVGGTVVDGTGTASFLGDVGVRDGRIVAVAPAGALREPARHELDATGLVVCPGFVDLHTHYDAQLFWDPLATPSNVHGVTSVVGGNCSFSIAPLRDADADYTRRMLAKVEGMPLEALEQGVPWTWGSFGEYLAALDGNVGVNAGFMVGHSALRRFVLGTEANRRAATPAELARLRAVLGDALAQGALGLSTDVSHSHSDGNGDPVPARGADTEELLALCEETGRWPGTTLEGIFDGASEGFDAHELELLPQMSVRANRPLNWNLLVVDAKDPGRIDRHLAVSHRARELGGRVVALTMPVIVPMNMSFLNYCALNLMPGWGPILNAPVRERIEQLRDIPTRRMMVERANSDEAGMFRRLADFPNYVIGDTFSAANDGLAGRVVRDIAAERGDDDPFDTLVDIVLADDLRTVLWPSAPDDDDAHWTLRRTLWGDPDVFLGGSDAGAHLDRMCGSSYPTRLLADTLRGRRLVSLEWAVHALTGKPASLLGLRDRGTITEGAHADLVVFDPETIGSAPAALVRDLPGGAPRMIAGVHRRHACARQRCGDRRRRRANRRAARHGAPIRSRHRHRHRPLSGAISSADAAAPAPRRPGRPRPPGRRARDRGPLRRRRELRRAAQHHAGGGQPLRRGAHRRRSGRGALRLGHAHARAARARLPHRVGGQQLPLLSAHPRAARSSSGHRRRAAGAPR